MEEVFYRWKILLFEEMKHPILISKEYLIIENTYNQKKYQEAIISKNGINTMNYKVNTFYCDL